jgi:PhnB protein
MPGKVKAKPDGYHSITPYLVIKGAAKAIDFYKQALGAEELMRMGDPTTDRVGHAELKFGDAIVMMADEHPEMGYRSPQSIGGTPVSLMMYVDNVDAVFKKAISLGAKEQRPVKDQFYGDRSGTFEDPFGHVWTISTHVEDIPPEEMEKRAAEAMAQA